MSLIIFGILAKLDLYVYVIHLTSAATFIVLPSESWQFFPFLLINFIYPQLVTVQSVYEYFQVHFCALNDIPMWISVIN